MKINRLLEEHEDGILSLCRIEASRIEEGSSRLLVHVRIARNEAGDQRDESSATNTDSKRSEDASTLLEVETTEISAFDQLRSYDEDDSRETVRDELIASNENWIDEEDELLAVLAVDWLS